MTDAERIADGLVKAEWCACAWEDTKEPKYRLTMDGERFILDTGENSECVWIDLADMSEVVTMMQRGLQVKQILLDRGRE